MTDAVPFSDTTRAALEKPDFLAGLRALLRDAARAAGHSYDLIRIPLEAAGLSMSEARGMLEPPLGRKVSSMILMGRKPGMFKGVQGGEAEQDPAAQARSGANFPKLSRSTPKRTKSAHRTKKKSLEDAPTYKSLKEDKTHHVTPVENQVPVTPESGAEGGGGRLSEPRTVPVECAQSITTLAEQAGVEPEVALLSVTRWHNRPAWVMSQLSALVQIRTVQPVTSPTGMFLTAVKGGRPLEVPRGAQKEKALPAAVIYPEEAVALVGLEVLHDGELQRVIGLRARDYAALERLDSPGAITLLPWRALLSHSAGHVGAPCEREAPKEHRAPTQPAGGAGSTALEVAAALLGRAEGAGAKFMAQHLERHKLRGALT